MSHLSIEKERQAYNAILAAHVGSQEGLTTSLEQQIYVLLMGEGGDSGEGGGSGCGCEGHTFRLDEQVWGTWVDGKTIYRKIFTDIPYKSNGTFTNGNIDVSDLNIETVVRIEGTRHVNENFYPMSGNSYVYVVGNELRGNAESGVPALSVGKYVWIALYYTKRDGTAEPSASA